MPVLNLGFGEDAVGKGICPEGVVVLRIAEAKVKQKKDDPTRQYINWKFEPVAPDEVVGCRPIYSVSSLELESRWALKDFLEAVTGTPWADDNMSLDLDDLIGATVGANIIHEKDLKGQDQAKPRNFFYQG